MHKFNFRTKQTHHRWCSFLHLLHHSLVTRLTSHHLPHFCPFDLDNNLLTLLFFFSSAASPTLTPPSESSNGIPSSHQTTISAPNGSPASLQGHAQPTLPPTPPTLMPPSATSNGSAAAAAAAAASYLPPFSFHMSPEMMPKHPFLPYEFSALRAARALHHQHHHHQSPYPLPSQLSGGHPLQQQGQGHGNESSRLSPVSSSRPSSSSPTSSSHHHKLNSSMDLHDSDSEDEPIDVVKSAFVPILRPKLELADSTTPQTTHSPSAEDGNTTPPPPPPPPMSQQGKQKCDLKAPSSRKQILHVIAPQLQSPDTKLTKPQALTNGQHIAVWRPYWSLLSRVLFGGD